MSGSQTNIISLLCSDLTLFAAEWRIADYILANPQEAANMTQSQLAAQSGSSEATVSRFCKKLGFENYRVFQLTLARDVRETRQIGAYSNNVSMEDIPQSLENILNNKLNEITATIHSLSEDSLLRVLDLLRNASIIEVAAVGNTIPVALDASFKFKQLGLRCVMSEILEHQSAFALTLTPQDLLFLISHSGRSRRLLDIAKIARERRVPIVLITGDPSSPLARVSDHCLYSTNLESLLTTKEFTLSRISALTIIEVLYLFLVSSMPTARRNISQHEETMRSDKIL